MVTPINEAKSPLSFARRYARQGYRIFPVWWAEIADSGNKCACGDTDCRSPAKHPVVPMGYKEATTDLAPIEKWWQRWPKANIGMVMAPELVAIDIDPRNGGNETIEAIEAQHGLLQSDLLAFTGGGGQHRVFAVPAGQSLPGRLGPGVDVKYNGYILVEPSNHISGGAYTWEASSDPLDGASPSPLPDWVRDVRAVATVASIAPVASQVPVQTWREVISALVFLDPDEYHSWINNGMSIYSLDSTAVGLSQWSLWSAQSSKFDPAIQAQKWATFKDKGLDGRTIKSLFKDAQDRGWLNPQSNGLRLTPEEIQAYQQQPQPIIVRKGQTIPFRAFPVDALNEAWKWIGGTFGNTHPLLSQAAVLAAASATAARRFTGYAGRPIHLYLALFGHTTTEARYALVAAERLMFDAGLRASVRGSRFSSPQQLYGSLNRSPSILYCADDYGDQLRFARRQPSGLLEQTLAQVSGRMRDASTITLDWAEIGQKQPPGAAAQCVIYAPSVTLLSIIAGNQIQVALKRSELSRGALDSMVFVPALDEEGWIERPPMAVQKAPAHVLECLRRMRGFQDGQTDETQSQLFQAMAGTEPSPIAVRYTGNLSQAAAGLRQHYNAHGRDIRSLVRGAQENIARVSAILAACADPVAPIATEEMVNWAAHFVGCCLSATVAEYQMLGGGEDKPDNYDLIQEVIARYQDKGLTRRELAQFCRAYRALSPDKRDDIIDQMISDGALFEIGTASGRTKSLVYKDFVEQPETVQTNRRQGVSPV